MNSISKPIAIIGGGMLGLTLAWRLAARGRRAMVLEGSDRLGGLADAWRLGPLTWDRHYHVTLLSDSHLRRLLAELNLDEAMRWVTTRTGFFIDERLHSLSSSWEFLRFPPLSLWDKFRLGWTIWRASRLTDWRALEQIPVIDWLQSLSGPRVTERIWLPLLRAKLGDAWERTSAAFLWATIARMYAARRSGLKRELFGYLPGGYARLLERFSERLQAAGVEIRLSSAVKAVTRSDAGLAVELASGETLACERAVVTAAAPLAAQLCPQLSAEEQRRLRETEYLGILCASVLLKRPLSPFYVTNVADAGYPFTGVIEMTALVPPQELAGRSLVYLPKYLTTADPAWNWSDADVRRELLGGLMRMHPDLREDEIEAFQVSRVRQVFALSTLGYSQRVQGPETSIPGLFLVNSSQIVNGTLNVNETVKLAEEALDLVDGKTTQQSLPSAQQVVHA